MTAGARRWLTRRAAADSAGWYAWIAPDAADRATPQPRRDTRARRAGTDPHEGHHLLPERGRGVDRRVERRTGHGGGLRKPGVPRRNHARTGRIHRFVRVPVLPGPFP